MIPTKSHCSQWLFVYDSAVAQQLGLVVVLCRPAVEALHLAKVMVQALTAMAQQLGLVVAVQPCRPAVEALHLVKLTVQALTAVAQQLGLVVPRQQRRPAVKAPHLDKVWFKCSPPWPSSSAWWCLLQRKKPP